MKKIFAICLCFILCVFSFSCKSDQFKWPYTVEDRVKENLMWDTAKLFETVPEIKSVGYSAGTVELFKFKSAGYQSKENTWVFCALGVPNENDFPKPKDGYPAVVLVHGGAGQVYTDWVKYWNEKGFIAIAFDTYSNQLDVNLNKTFNPDGGPTEYSTGSINDTVKNYKGSWVYHVVTNVILCNNLLRNRADVDKTKIVATGISWGSVALCITAGVDKRFAGFAPVYGGGYVYDDSFFIDAYTKSTAFGGETGKQEWIDTYDASSYLPYATKPMFFVSGIDDIAFNVKNRAKIHSLPNGKVFYSQRSDLIHGHLWQQTLEIYYFFRHILYNEEFPLIGELKSKGNVVTLADTDFEFSTVSVMYTTSTVRDSHDWVFVCDDAEFSGGKYSYKLPENVTAYAFEMECESGNETYKISTKIYLK